MVKHSMLLTNLEEKKKNTQNHTTESQMQFNHMSMQTAVPTERRVQIHAVRRVGEQTALFSERASLKS